MSEVVIVGIACGGVIISSISVAAAPSILDRTTCIDQVVPTISISILDIVEIIVEVIVYQEIRIIVCLLRG